MKQEHIKTSVSPEPKLASTAALLQNGATIHNDIMAKTLAVDLGTHTGWALIEGPEIIDSGTELLATEDELRRERKEGKERTLDIRFVRFYHFLERQLSGGVTRIVFEDVIFAGSQAQTQLWASLRAAIWAIAWNSSIEVFCVPVATLKRFATGNGHADKIQMGEALSKAEPDRFQADPITRILQHGGRLIDDNEVDAIWLAHYAIAVDRHEQEFLSVFKRKSECKAERRAKQKVAKTEKKARQESQTNEVKLKHHALMSAIKAAGRCCDVFRKPTTRGRAICPKCFRTIRIPIMKGSEGPARSSGDGTVQREGNENLKPE